MAHRDDSSGSGSGSGSESDGEEPILFMGPGEVELIVYVIRNRQQHVLAIPFEGRMTQLLFGDASWAATVAERMEAFYEDCGRWPRFHVPLHESDPLPPARGLPLQRLQIEGVRFEDCIANAAQYRLDLMLVDEIINLETGILDMNGHAIQFEIDPSADLLHNMWDPPKSTDGPDE